jgi:hypothetical protein
MWGPRNFAPQRICGLFVLISFTILRPQSLVAPIYSNAIKYRVFIASKNERDFDGTLVFIVIAEIHGLIAFEYMRCEGQIEISR